MGFVLLQELNRTFNRKLLVQDVFWLDCTEYSIKVGICSYIQFKLFQANCRSPDKAPTVSASLKIRCWCRNFVTD